MGSTTFGDGVLALAGMAAPQQYETYRGAVAREGMVGRT